MGEGAPCGCLTTERCNLDSAGCMAKQIQVTGIGQRWAGGLSSRTDKIRAGIDAVTESPGRKAAAQADVWANNTVAAKEKFRANVGAVTLEDWKSATAAKVDRVTSGAQAAADKFETKMGPVIAHLQTGLNRLDGMPRGSLDQNLERANTLARHMASFKRNR